MLSKLAHLDSKFGSIFFQYMLMKYTGPRGRAPFPSFTKSSNFYLFLKYPSNSYKFLFDNVKFFSKVNLEIP